MYPTTSQNSPHRHPFWLSNAGRTLNQSDWPKKDNLENNPIIIKTGDCEPRGRAVLLCSLTLLLSTQVPLPNKVSCFVSLCAS